MPERVEHPEAPGLGAVRQVDPSEGRLAQLDRPDQLVGIFRRQADGDGIDSAQRVPSVTMAIELPLLVWVYPGAVGLIGHFTSRIGHWQKMPTL